MDFRPYRPIKSWQTRLLRLHPGSGDDDLQGDLVIVDMMLMDEGVVVHENEDHVKFEALSYCWGSSETPSFIQLEGQAASIGLSLGLALRRLRFFDETRLLWADAICIDQKNDREKSAQVSNMFNIYSRARVVLVWLGESGPHTDVAVAHLETGELGTSTDSTQPLPESPPDLATLALVRDGLMDLVSRQWIRRIWVQQEIFAARSVHFYCGCKVLTFGRYQLAGPELERISSLLDGPGYIMQPDIRIKMAILKLMRHFSPYYRALLVAQRQQHYACSPCDCDRLDEPSTNGNIACLLRRSHDLFSTDVRDRIFALLNMSNCQVGATDSAASYADGTAVVTDYSMTPSLVFQNFTKYLINRTKSFHPLGWHQPNRAHGNDLSLPSWCPDWRSCAHGENGSNPMQRFLHQSYNNVDRLSLPGILLATRELGRSQMKESDNTSKFGELRHKLFAKESSLPLDTFSEQVTSTWKILVAERGVIHHVCGVEYLNRFTRFLNTYILFDGIQQGDTLVVQVDENYWSSFVLRPRPEYGYTFVGMAHRGDCVSDEPSWDVWHRYLSLERDHSALKGYQIFEVF